MNKAFFDALYKDLGEGIFAYLQLHNFPQGSPYKATLYLEPLSKETITTYKKELSWCGVSGSSRFDFAQCPVIDKEMAKSFIKEDNQIISIVGWIRAHKAELTEDDIIELLQIYNWCDGNENCHIKHLLESEGFPFTDKIVKTFGRSFDIKDMAKIKYLSDEYRAELNKEIEDAKQGKVFIRSLVTPEVMDKLTKNWRPEYLEEILDTSLDELDSAVQHDTFKVYVMALGAILKHDLQTNKIVAYAYIYEPHGCKVEYEGELLVWGHESILRIKLDDFTVSETHTR